MKRLKRNFLLTLLTACIPFMVYAADIPSTPVTASTDAAKNLYAYFLDQYGKKTISSVMANVNWNNTCAEKVYKLTGKYPAMNCYDFIHICFSPANWIDYTDITPVKDWHDAGGIVQLMWHFNVPKSQGSTDFTCTPSETTFKASNALVSGTWENTWFYEQMDKVAASILKLQEAGIAATWRPFHEAAGNACAKQQADWTKAWFWWGYDGADTYKKLWIAMYDYFKQKGINNLIWMWTTQNYNGDSSKYNQDTNWYPGDQYVDIIARDLYGYDAAQNLQEFNEIQATYPNKMVVLGECGYGNNGDPGKMSDVWAKGAKWGHFMVWYQGGQGSTDTMCSDDWWKDAMSSANVITRDKVVIPDVTSTIEDATDAVKNMGLGWNLGNALDANNQQYHDATQDNYWGQQDVTSESCWGQLPTKAELMAMMKNAGFGAIRVPVTWYNHMDKDGNVDAAWMNRVHEVVDYVISQGMYCILNVHHDTGADSYDSQKNLTGYHWIKADETNYATNKARYEKLWQQIAQEFRNYDQHLLFEGYNEMLDANSSWNFAQSNSSYDAINKYAQSFVDVVRATGGNNAQRNLIVSTYGASSGSGTWNAKIQDPLKKLQIPSGESNHIIFEVHNYPSIVNKDNAGNYVSDRTISEIKAEIDAWLENLKTHLISKGAPVIIGEWGTNNVDAGGGKTDYDLHKDLMFEFVSYMIKTMKQNDIATFYWMGLSDGAPRTYPAFTQPDLALKMLQAYHGDSWNPYLPDAKDFPDGKITSATVNYNNQWGELTIHKGAIDKNVYKGLKVELEEKPNAGTLSFKVYASSEKATAITSKTPQLAFSNYTGIEKINLQWNVATKGSIKIKSVNLVKHDNTLEPCGLEVDWGCTLSDQNYATGIESITTTPRPTDGIIYNLSGQQVATPTHGIYIKSGKKYIKR
nr:bifunctional mannanase-xyloglucanase [uncultured bacterium]